MQFNLILIIWILDFNSFHSISSCWMKHYSSQQHTSQDENVLKWQVLRQFCEEFFFHFKKAILMKMTFEEEAIRYIHIKLYISNWTDSQRCKRKNAINKITFWECVKTENDAHRLFSFVGKSSYIFFCLIANLISFQNNIKCKIKMDEKIKVEL